MYIVEKPFELVVGLFLQEVYADKINDLRTLNKQKTVFLLYYRIYVFLLPMLFVLLYIRVLQIEIKAENEDQELAAWILETKEQTITQYTQHINSLNYSIEYQYRET